MADFVAVLKKTIGSLSDNTPEMREKVFAKARSTIEAKLAAIDPPPPQAVADRQRKALEDAIAVVRSEYDGPADPDGADEEFESLMASLAAYSPPDPQDAPAVEPEVEPEAVDSSQAPGKDTRETHTATGDEAAPDASEDRDHVPEAPASEPVMDASDDYRHGFKAPLANSANEDLQQASGEQRIETIDEGSFNDGDVADTEPREDDEAGSLASLDADARSPTPLVAGNQTAGVITDAKPKRRWKGPLVAIIALLFAAGGAYGIWLNQDELSRMVGGGSAIEASEAEETLSEADDAVVEADEPAAQQAALEAGDLAALNDEDSGPEQATDDAAEKFTQRLLPDGSEIDEGPADEVPSIGEGSSISSVSPDADGEAQIAQNDNADEAAVAQDDVSVPVGQRAIFYEERTNTAQGSAQTGSTVWRRVEESPGSDLPPEPAIRAEATIPDMNLQLRMTIRRNGDETLPASHIIEMIFLTPEDFEGGGIDNISRITFKDSEQAAGNPLLGIPAKIADGFFLLALNEAASDVETNLTLMQRLSWVDIPLVYRSGRRALVTLEKGVPGDRVFQEVIGAWTEEESG